jgi:hypothetical protein
MGTTHVREFMARLVKMNENIPYFLDKPNGNRPDKLGNDEILDTIIRAKQPEMSIQMLRSNIDPYRMTIEGLVDYLERLELSIALEQKEANNNLEQKPPAKIRKKGAKMVKQKTTVTTISNQRKISAVLIVKETLTTLLIVGLKTQVNNQKENMMAVSAIAF